MGPKKSRKSIENGNGRNSNRFRAGTEPPLETRTLLLQSQYRTQHITTSSFDGYDSQEDSFSIYDNSRINEFHQKPNIAPPLTVKKSNNNTLKNTIGQVYQMCIQILPILLHAYALMAIIQNNTETNLSISHLQQSLDYLNQSVQVLQDNLEIVKDNYRKTSIENEFLQQSIEEILEKISLTSNNLPHSNPIPIYTHSGMPDTYIEIPGIREKPNQNELKKLFRKFQKSLFPNQFSETWSQIYSGIKKSFEENPSHPASILILVPPEMQTEEFSKCFVERLGSEIHKLSHSSGTNKPKEKSSSELNNAKYSDLKSELEIYFNDGDRLVIFQDVNLIMNESILMLLHALMDNRNSINPNAIFISTAAVPGNIYKRYEWIPENAIRISQEVLRTEWSKTLARDDITPLISRLAVNVVLLNNDNCK